jgi:plastocyanin
MKQAFQNLSVALVGVALIGVSSAARADDWGSLKGRFIFDGTAPAAPALNVDKDQAICGNKGLVNEELVVDAKGNIANVGLWVLGKVAVHPDYEKTANDTVILDNKGCRFEPHVVGVRVGQTLSVKNDDPVAHNSFLGGANLQGNPLIAVGGSSEFKVEGLEKVPVPVSCSIHTWMKSKVLVRPNPYFAVSAADGTFEIKNLPAGDLQFKVWQEKAGYVTDATVDGKAEKWEKGVMKVAIPAGGTKDLGDIKLGADQFNK